MLLGSFVHLFLGEMSLEYLFLLLSGFWCEGFSDLTLVLFWYLLELKGHPKICYFVALGYNSIRLCSKKL